MFHPLVIEEKIETLLKEPALRPPAGRVERLPLEQSLEWASLVSKAYDEQGRQVRPFTEEEAAFVGNEVFLSKVDFRYWCRYARINKAGAEISPIFPFLDSQEFILSRVADIELSIFRGEREDGILINLLKGARQIGGSSLAEAIECHGSTLRTNVFGLIAADVPEQSAYMFDMYERMYENLPPWLAPSALERVKNVEIAFDTGSRIWVGSGKSTRGTVNKRGQLGRGKSLSLVHLSEVSTWDVPEQIDDALVPAMPAEITTFAMLESTAKGRGNWWHNHWLISESDHGRFLNIFTPWYIERKYMANPPEGWEPSPKTLRHAERVLETSPRWAGSPIRLTKEQLYWYDIQRSYYEKKGRLSAFIEEFGAVEPDESFQHSGRSIFPTDLLNAIDEEAKQPIAAFTINPRF